MHTVLLIYFLVFFLAAFAWPLWRLWRREGVNGLVLPRDDSAHGLVGRWFTVVLAGVVAMLAALAAGLPSAWLGPLRWMEADAPRIAGAGLMAVSLVWIVVAQRQMGRSWRIGIDRIARPPLVREGLFARSRNPIFLGMRVSLLGLFLALPNAVTFACLLLGEVVIQVQVRLEEEHLSAAFGEAYADYRRTTSRWLIG